MQLPTSLSLVLPLALAAFTLAASGSPQAAAAAARDEKLPAGSIAKKDWGEVDGKPVQLWTLKNGKGMEAEITNYGTIIVSLKVPDVKRGAVDVVLGRESHVLKGSAATAQGYNGSIVVFRVNIIIRRCRNENVCHRFRQCFRTCEIAALGLFSDIVKKGI